MSQTQHTTESKPYLGEDSADVLRAMAPDEAKVVLEELRGLQALETNPETSAPVDALDHGYRATELPRSGYVAVYRRLLPAERESVGSKPDEDAVLVADLEPATASARAVAD